MVILILVVNNLIDIVDYGYLVEKLFELRYYVLVVKFLWLAVLLLNYEVSEVDFVIVENVIGIDGFLF